MYPHTMFKTGARRDRKAQKYAEESVKKVMGVASSCNALILCDS